MLEKILKFRLRFNPKALVSLIAITVILGVTHSILVAALEYSGETPPLGLVIATRLSYALFIINLLSLAAYVILLVGTHLLPNFPELFRFEETDDRPASSSTPEEAAQVGDLVESIGRRLEEIEGGKSKALVHLQDVNVQAATLVRLIRTMMRKRERMLQQADALDEAIGAIGGRDRVAIARAAGRLEDGVIRSLLLELNHNGDADFGLEVLDTMAAQQGALRDQAQLLKDLSLTWVNRLADYRVQAMQLGTTVDALDSLRPVSLLDARLHSAQEELRMVNSPEANRMLRQAEVPLLES
jgi:hypothetical protein